jgi:hypothetical protein
MRRQHAIIAVTTAATVLAATDDHLRPLRTIYPPPAVLG